MKCGWCRNEIAQDETGSKEITVSIGNHIKKQVAFHAACFGEWEKRSEQKRVQEGTRGRPRK